MINVWEARWQICFQSCLFKANFWSLVFTSLSVSLYLPLPTPSTCLQVHLPDIFLISSLHVTALNVSSFLWIWCQQEEYMHSFASFWSSAQNHHALWYYKLLIDSMVLKSCISISKNAICSYFGQKLIRKCATWKQWFSEAWKLDQFWGFFFWLRASCFASL